MTERTASTDAARERQRASDRKWRAANLEKAREKDRRYSAANKEKKAAYHRNRREANLDLARQQEREKARRRSPESARLSRAKVAHGADYTEVFAAMWQEQDGRCYLCDAPLSMEPRKLHVDHDHACCPKGKSCSYCRRGLACDTCNVIIGMAHDDPDLLRRIAGNLDRVLPVVRARIASKPQQLMLG